MPSFFAVSRPAQVGCSAGLATSAHTASGGAGQSWSATKVSIGAVVVVVVMASSSGP
jgi:hypothetical protein